MRDQPKRTEHPDPAKRAVRKLINGWLKRSGLTQLVVTQRIRQSKDAQGQRHLEHVGEDYFSRAYKSQRKSDRLNDDAELALATIKVFCDESLPHNKRCPADEALRFLNIVRVRAERWGEIANCFSVKEWQQACDQWFTQSLIPNTTEVLQQPTRAKKPRQPICQLPPPMKDFVGRVAEQEQLISVLTQDLEHAAIAVIRGLGGIGKTQLVYAVARELVRRFPDGQLFLSLGGMSNDPLPPEQVLRMAIRAVEPETALPDNAVTLQHLYWEKLAGKRMLILADDARDAQQVRSLIPPTGCALLITSRNRFVLPGMVAVKLDLLASSEAEKLLLGICPRIEQHAATLAKLCGYLPLALRLSASLLASSDTRHVAD